MSHSDTADSPTKTETLSLVEIPSGRTCKFVGIAQDRRRFSGEHEYREKHRRSGYDNEVGIDRSFHLGGRRILRRLLDLGITSGCVFEVIHGGKSGPILIQVRGTRVALGQGLASKLLVEVVEK
ncbi:MAG: ferrous iron transport protein A [Candidatus Thorarchaeota archaeon]